MKWSPHAACAQRGTNCFGVAFESCFMLVEFDVTCCSCWNKKDTLYRGRGLAGTWEQMRTKILRALGEIMVGPWVATRLGPF